MRLLSRILETRGDPQADEQAKIDQIEALLSQNFSEAALTPPDLVSELEALAQKNDQPLPALSEPLRTQLQTANRFTRALVTEAYGQDQICAELQRLQRPLLRLALRHPELFDSDDSPIVNLINQLDHAAQWGSADPQLAQTLDQHLSQWRERLGRCDADNLLPCLQQLTQTLRQWLQPLQEKRQRRLQRLIDSHIGRQRIARARLTVFDALRGQFGDTPLPQLLIELLQAGWFHLLVLTHINHGEDSPQWHHHLESLVQLQYWLMGEDPVPEAQAQALLEQIDRELEQVCANSVQQQRLIQQLSACLIGAEQCRIRARLPRRPLDPADFLDPDLLRKPAPWPREVRQLSVGEWIRIQKDGKPQAYKLIWISEIPPRFVFTDPSGRHKLELKPKQLALLFRNHTAARIANLDLPLMDRATDRVLNELRTPEPRADEKTGLILRRDFLHHLRYALWRSGAPQTSHVVCQVEFDLLQTITSICGEVAEDALLQQIIALLRETMPDNALITRLRDNAFAILLPDHSLEQAMGVARRLNRHLSTLRFRHSDQDFSLDAPIGLVPFAWGESPETVLLNANATCMKARHRGRNSIEVYKEVDRGIEREKNLLTWAGRINRLFERDQLYLRCQRIAPLRDGLPGHHEILIGAHDDNGDILPPDRFIPAIEHFQRGPELDRWVLRQVVKWLTEHRQQLARLGGFSINLSGQSVLDPEFYAFLETLLAQHPDLVPHLTFEITETAAVGSFEQAARFIRGIKRFGCRFSLDDFGTGYASYAYLKHFDFDYLKIDGSFICSILDNPTDEEIVKSMNQIGHSLGLKTVAEYVENDAIRAKLQAIGLDYGQGFGIAKPIPLAELELSA